VKVTVELSKDAVKKLEDIQKRFGFRSLDDAASYVLNRYIKFVMPVEEAIYRLMAEKIITDMAEHFIPRDEIAEILIKYYIKEG
jgi:hypothetical protein